MNFPAAIAQVFKQIKQLPEKEDTRLRAAQAILDFCVDVLGLTFDFQYLHVQAPNDIKDLAEKRQQYRLSKQWAQADQCREAIALKGWEIVDTTEGYQLVLAKN